MARRSRRGVPPVAADPGPATESVTATAPVYRSGLMGRLWMAG